MSRRSAPGGRRRLRRGLGAAVVVVATVVLLVTAVAASGAILPIDRAGLEAADGVQAPLLTDVMVAVTQLGSFYATVPAALVAAWLFAAAGARRDAVALLLGLALTVGAVQLLKAVLARPRPDDPLVEVVGHAYPSGNAAKALVFAYIAHRAARTLHAPWAPAMLAVGLAVAAAVGVSRLYLEAHYVTDVLGGWAVAVLAFAGAQAPAILRRRSRVTGPEGCRSG